MWSLYFFQLLSEFIILSVGAIILIYEYTRQLTKEEAKQATIEREKQELKDQVDEITFVVQEQSAQIRELSRITFALRDDLERASKKNSGFLGLGSSKNKSTTTQEVEYDNTKPITSAVIQMNLRSV